jgi:hypothetical protein
MGLRRLRPPPDPPARAPALTLGVEIRPQFPRLYRHSGALCQDSRQTGCSNGLWGFQAAEAQ